MHERGKAGEVGLIECQTCEKKIYVVKKILGKFFLKFFSLNLILLYILNYFYHFQPFLYYKNLVRINLGIRIKNPSVPQISDEKNKQVFQI